MSKNSIVCFLSVNMRFVRFCWYSWHSVMMCLTVIVVLQASQMGDSSFDIRNPWVIRVYYPILRRFMVVSYFRFRLGVCHLKIVLLIWFNLVVWIFQIFCNFFLTLFFEEFLKSSWKRKSSVFVSVSDPEILAYLSNILLYSGKYMY